MRISRLLIVGAGALTLGACGGGNDSASTPAPSPPTSSTPPTPPATDFNAFVVSLVKQPDSDADKKSPDTVGDRAFTYSDDGTAYSAALTGF